MKQLDLLSNNPIARNTDISSSHIAAWEISADGTRTRQQHIIHQTLLEHPGHTSAELVAYCELDRYQIARRLPELEQAGFVVKGEIRTCQATGRKAVTWSPRRQ